MTTVKWDHKGWDYSQLYPPRSGPQINLFIWEYSYLIHNNSVVTNVTIESFVISQLAAVTEFVIPADCSHRVRDPIWVGFDSWDHKVCDCNQLAVITTFVIPAGCSHRLCDPS